jgi:sigma-B regulation protein RsbU (phosphoserine phosphatase)
VQLLKAKGSPIGLKRGAAYARETVIVPGDSRLYLFSDGAYEVEGPDGRVMSFDDLVDLLKHPGQDSKSAGQSDRQSDLDLLFQHLVRMRGANALDDDFSIVRFAL